MGKGVKRIQIYNMMIINRKVSHKAFALYVLLKEKAFNKNQVRIRPEKITSTLGWDDNRTLKKHLEVLYQNHIVDSHIDKVFYYKPIEMKLIELHGEAFTQLDIYTIEKIRNATREVLVEEKDGSTNKVNLYAFGIRYFYYLEKNYNKHYNRAFPSYSKISKDLGFGRSYISTLNDIFMRNNLVEVISGGWREEETETAIRVKREVNSYVPKCNRK